MKKLLILVLALSAQVTVLNAMSPMDQVQQSLAANDFDKALNLIESRIKSSASVKTFLTSLIQNSWNALTNGQKNRIPKIAAARLTAAEQQEINRLIQNANAGPRAFEHARRRVIARSGVIREEAARYVDLGQAATAALTQAADLEQQKQAVHTQYQATEQKISDLKAQKATVKTLPEAQEQELTRLEAERKKLDADAHNAQQEKEEKLREAQAAKAQLDAAVKYASDATKRLEAEAKNIDDLAKRSSISKADAEAILRNVNNNEKRDESERKEIDKAAGKKYKKHESAEDIKAGVEKAEADLKDARERLKDTSSLLEQIRAGKALRPVTAEEKKKEKKKSRLEEQLEERRKSMTREEKEEEEEVVTEEWEEEVPLTRRGASTTSPASARSEPTRNNK